jgi:hypothetical protein
MTFSSCGQNIRSNIDENENSEGNITGKTIVNIEAVYGNALEYSKDIYLGILYKESKFQLLDKFVYKNEFNHHIIKVKILTEENVKVLDMVNRTGWIKLTSTDLVDRYYNDLNVIK